MPFVTIRRRMPRHHYKLKLRACERTTSVSWRSPTVPPPSWRSLQSGCLTPSTWTDARCCWPLSTGRITTTQADFKLFSNVRCTTESHKETSVTLVLLQTSANMDVNIILPQPHGSVWIVTTKDKGESRVIDKKEQRRICVSVFISMLSLT